TDSIKETVRRATPGRWVPHPGFWAVACDYRTGKRVPFGRVDAPTAHVADAVAASCAIPGFFRPVQIGGRPYVDGGVCSASSLDLLAGCGLDGEARDRVAGALRPPSVDYGARLRAAGGIAAYVLGAAAAQARVAVPKADLDERDPDYIRESLPGL